MYISLFVIGFFGSLHCVSMCGPLMVLMGFKGKNNQGKINAFWYHLARVLTYGLMGGIVGGFMYGLNWFGISQIISILFGCFFIVFGTVSFFGKSFNILEQSKISGIFAQHIKGEKSWGKYMLSGALNALLPCGLVYVALASATLSQRMSQGFLSMAFFGLGTFPAMYLSSVFSTQIKSYLKGFNSKKWINSTYIFIGVLFLIRGLNLDIPYFSPSSNAPNEKVNCCTQH